MTNVEELCYEVLKTDEEKNKILQAQCDRMYRALDVMQKYCVLLLRRPTMESAEEFISGEEYQDKGKLLSSEWDQCSLAVATILKEAGTGSDASLHLVKKLLEITGEDPGVKAFVETELESIKKEREKTAKRIFELEKSVEALRSENDDLRIKVENKDFQLSQLIGK